MAYSGLWNGVNNENYALQVDKAPVEKKVNKYLRRSRYGARQFRELLVTLVNGAVGATAADTVAQREAVADVDNNVQGGAVNIVDRTFINRATVASDVTAVNTALTHDSQPDTYPVDISGNGGGGDLTKQYAPG